MFRKLRRMSRWDEATTVRVMTSWLCAGDPRIGRLTRWLAHTGALYAYSPYGRVDFVPDFLPLIGHLNDLLSIPVIARILQRWVPQEVWSGATAQARSWVAARGIRARPTGIRIALWAVAIAVLLLLAAAIFGVWVLFQVLVAPKD